jgi:hypothetical protein
MSTFCQHLNTGLVYNNDTYIFTVSPCCYFLQTDEVKQDLVEHRAQWQKSDLQTNCRICIEAENSGLHSYRQASFDWMTGTGKGIEFLTVAVNKKCNLACVSCDSASSSFWYQENNRHNVIQPINIKKLHEEDRAGNTTKQFLDLLAKQDLSLLKYIKFGGGEPLMSDTHLRILKLVNNPENVTIQYTSNFSIMPTAEVLEQWNKFKLVKWVASIDGVGDQFSFLRWPYDWKNLNSFVKKAIQLVPGNVMFGVEHTLNPLNVFYFDKFQTWFDQYFAANRYGDLSNLNLHLCTGNLGIEQTPLELKKIILDKFGPDHLVVKILQQTSYSGDTKKIVNHLDQIDRWRNSQWRKIFPEVESYFSA